MENVKEIVDTLAGSCGSAGTTTTGQLTGTINAVTTGTSWTYTGDLNQTGTYVPSGNYVVSSGWPTTYYRWPNYWPAYYEDKTARAFRVVKVLQDKKLVKLKDINAFVKLVDEIVLVL